MLNKYILYSFIFFSGMFTYSFYSSFYSLYEHLKTDKSTQEYFLKQRIIVGFDPNFKPKEKCQCPSSEMNNNLNEI